MSLTAEDIIASLAFPRENATPGLEQGRAVLDSLLQQANVVVNPETFSSSPHRLAAVGICLGLVVLGLIAANLRQQLRWRVVVLVGLCLAVVFVSGGFDSLLPHTAATNLLVEVAPSSNELRTVMLSAHYDSKTEAVDHTLRGLLVVGILLTSPLAVTALFGARTRRQRLALSLPAILILSVTTIGTALAPLVPERSHGIRDNAAACALLVELCSRAAHRPLAHTRLQFAWWAAEEIGAQGSDIWVQRHPTGLPDYLINLEAIGSGGDLALVALEWNGRTWSRPSDELARMLDEVAPRKLRRLWIPLLSDAGPFLGMGTPAVTVLNLRAEARWPTSLHTKADRLHALQASGVDATRNLLLEGLRSLDAMPAAADR